MAAAQRFADAEMTTCPLRRQVVNARADGGHDTLEKGLSYKALQNPGAPAQELLGMSVQHVVCHPRPDGALEQEQCGDDEGRAS